MAAETPTATAKSAAQDNGKGATTEREYVVLAEISVNGDQRVWTIVSREQALNDTEARKQANAKRAADERDNELVAVPARYWKPKARKVHQPPPVESWD